MNKIFTTLLSILFITLSVNAQNPLPNPGFENWTNAGIYENPDSWSTLNPTTATLGVLTALKASGADAHSGSFAIQLTTKLVFSQVANGIATTGSINTTTQTISGGIPYTQRPDSITGWYKYTSVSGDNGFLAFVLLDAVDDTIGFANFTTPASNVSVYTYFSTAVNYFNSGTPVTARCLLSSSAGFTAVVNSTLFIDDLQLVFNSSSIREDLPTNAVSLDYHSFSKIITINSLSSIIHKAELMDLNGKILESFPINAKNAELKINTLAAGIYMVILYNEQSDAMLTKKILVE